MVCGTFDEALENFFNQTYGLQKIRLEWAYGFYEGLARHSDYIALNELKKIIDNEMEESCHWHLQQWLEKVKELLIFLSESEDNQRTNRAFKAITKDTLENVFISVAGERFENKVNLLVECALEVSARALAESKKEAGLNDGEVRLSAERTMEQSEPLENEGKVKHSEVNNVEDLFRTAGQLYAHPN
ncbi:unnamed protein product [Echinostoma caproni]|uniref:Cullin domain-containing protein n=1 Tax=Echinostoma caproni TaxID=27848 RepID=A0A183A0E5_9TREM|nr:unnamed protein product [Echinostoma caproni]